MQAVATHSLPAGSLVGRHCKPAQARQLSSFGACSAAESSSRAAPRHARQQRWAARAAPSAEPRQPSQLDYDDEHDGFDAYGESIGENDIGILDAEAYTTGMPDGIAGKAGYTPYDFIDFTDVCSKHEVVAKVDKPISEVYALWCNRLNWPEWFAMIEEVGFKDGEDDLCALNLWYRWASTPWLELYVALRRTRAEVNKYIMEEPEDGAPIVAAVLFQEAEDSGSTVVTLRISYLLPRVLFEFAGQMAVYGDVDRKLARCMTRMKDFIEAADTADVQAAQAAAMAGIRAGLPEHHEQQAAYDAEWEVEKQRRQQKRDSNQQAAAAQLQEDTEAAAAAATQAASAAARVAAAVEAEAAAAAPRRRGRKPAGSVPADPATVMNPMAKSKKARKADAPQ